MKAATSDNKRLTRSLPRQRKREYLDDDLDERWRVRTWRSLIDLVLVVKLVDLPPIRLALRAMSCSRRALSDIHSNNFNEVLI